MGFISRFRVFTQHISKLLQKYPHYTLHLSDGSKTSIRAIYAHSIDGEIVSQRIRNIASIFTAELMGIFTWLSHLCPNHRQMANSFSLTLSLSTTLPYKPIQL